MKTTFNLDFNENEVHALEIILSCVDSTKLANTNSLALSLHHLKLSDIFLTLEKLQDYIKKNIKREDE
ncbi:MAG: hypothetical protein OEV44_03330 [Spirochaetota bacterium]|nr:hypothetical protein [Spirochaetota bacterium]